LHANNIVRHPIGESRLRTAPYQSSLVKLWNLAAKLKHDSNKGDPFSLTEFLHPTNKESSNGRSKTDPHIDALACLLSSLNNSGNLHPFGRFYVKTLFNELLVNRAQLSALWKRNPEILNEKISRPLIILGLPRSGTSFIFNLLAQDPNHRFLRNWETTVSQSPPEGYCTYQHDPRRRKGRFLMYFQNFLAPHLKDIHEFYLDGPEECTPLLMQGFATQAFSGMFNVPAYSAWLDTASHTETYQHHKRILQTLQWKYPGQRWLLKSPDHLAAVDSIMEVYPDACLVHLHREPVQSISSWASLNAAFRGIYMHSIDSEELGFQALDRLSKDMDSYLIQRHHHNPDQFLDVYYHSLISDPLGVVQKIYQHFDLEFAPDTKQIMSVFLDVAGKKSGPHRYTTEQFGLSPDVIRTRFKNYIDAFHVSHAR
jgi:sulfotransferase family protein